MVRSNGGDPAIGSEQDQPSSRPQSYTTSDTLYLSKSARELQGEVRDRERWSNAAARRRERSKWNPKAWSRKTQLIIAIVVVFLTVLIGSTVCGVHEGQPYPDYKPLAYRLRDTYSGVDFFENFDYFTGYDPTYGFVHYVPRETAQSPQYNLTYANADSAVLKVDTTETNASTGRFSARITSKKQFSGGLFVFDILNTPWGCSTWPALWSTDPSNWPEHGEIDIIEATNKAITGNQATLHTTKQCSMDVKRKQLGRTLQANCDHTEHFNAGCGVQGADSTYGEMFNSAGGGIYAMEWRKEGIRIWSFPRSQIPSDIPEDVSNVTAAPDPSTWGTPLADFPSTRCDIGSHFKNQSIVANIDLCGSLAGTVDVYSEQNACPGKCSDFVATRPEAFESAFWEWRSWRVYAADDG